MSSIARIVCVRVPATTANLGPGFDCLGLALQWYNIVELQEPADETTSILIEGAGASEDLPQTEDNLTFRAIKRVFELAGAAIPPLRLRLVIEPPIARGLGSSASAIVGGMLAANIFLNHAVAPEQLVAEMIAMEGHPDNIVACYFGGLTASLVHGSDVFVRKYYPAPSIRCILVVPDYPLSTAQARKVLPRRVSTADAVFNLSRIPFVIDKLCSGELVGLDIFMEDRLHQPHRRKLIPEYDIVEAEALQAGAAAVCLSGSGPTILAIANEREAAQIAANVSQALTDLGRRCLVRVVAPDLDGAQEASAQGTNGRV